MDVCREQYLDSSSVETRAMRMPRLRISVRRLMVAVAAVALGLWWLVSRREEFRRLADYHQAKAFEHTTSGTTPAGTVPDAMWIPRTPRGEWHHWMAWKYR